MAREGGRRTTLVTGEQVYWMLPELGNRGERAVDIRATVRSWTFRSRLILDSRVVDVRVVFQKWRWTEIAVTLGLVFVASMRKEWPMTFIAVRCPHCQSDQIVKRGKTARGTQRYLCQNTACTTGSFLLDYRNRGCLPEVKHTIIDMSLKCAVTARAAFPINRDGNRRNVP